MGTFNTKEILSAPSTLIPTMADEVATHFSNQGYEVASDKLSSGGYDISISKGGMFKAVLGVKSALKISLLPQGNSIVFNASVGVFGKHVVPTLLMLYVGWPLFITQLWGLIKQSQLDDEALAVAKRVIDEAGVKGSAGSGVKFCTSCGTQNDLSANYCCDCGRKL